MKKTIQFTLFMLAILMPATASAYDIEVNGIYYNVNGNQATVTYQTTSYNSYRGDVTIPETINFAERNIELRLLEIELFTTAII